MKVKDGFYYNDCQQTFVKEVKLINHRKSKHGEKFSCNVCNKTFAKISNLKRQEESVHRKTESSMEECKSCLKIMRKDNLAKYIRPCLRRKERKEQKYKQQSEICNHCNRSFLNKKTLTEHIKVLNYMRFPCEHSEKDFIQNKLFMSSLNILRENFRL